MDPYPTPTEGRSEVAGVDPAAQPTEGASAEEAGPDEPAGAEEAGPDEPAGPVGGESSGGRGWSRSLGYPVAAAVGAVLTLAAFAAFGALPGARPSSASPSVSPSPTSSFAMEGATVGVAGAPVTIEIWADFQCPYCGLFTHGIEPTILREYAATGAAGVRFRDFAFLGQESVDAAVGARCAGREGKFWRYHDLLFASQRGENQGAFRRDTLVALAEFAGLGKDAFTACLDDPAVAEEVAAETATGRALGIESTPTLRIVGPGATRIIKGVSTPAAIAEAIAAAGAAPAASPAASPAAGSPAPPAPGSPAP